MVRPTFTVLEASLPLAISAAMLTAAVLWMPMPFYWPLLTGTALAFLLAHRRGYSVQQLAAGAWTGMKAAFVPVSILLLVGALIGVWVAAGTVPAMVYYGLGLVQPEFLVPAAFLLALASSMMLGTSIGTLSTLGVAIMGVAQGVGAPLPMVAGALVSGALFGDRSSPLSGSLHVNAAMTGTEPRRMWGILAPTGVLAAGVSLALYAWLGSGLSLDYFSAVESPLRMAVAMSVTLTPWLLAPPVLVLALSLVRIPVRQSLLAGVVAGLVLAATVGQQGWLVPLEAAVFGHNASTADPDLARVLSGGGMMPMAHQLILIVVAGAFNGVLEVTGMLQLIIERMVTGVRGRVALVGSTAAISIGVAMLAANQVLAIIVPGRMLKPIYERKGITAAVLSRTLADSGTVVAVLIPWNLLGVLSSAAVGVPVSKYAPYAWFPILMPIVTLAWTFVEDWRGRSNEGMSVR